MLNFISWARLRRSVLTARTGAESAVDKQAEEELSAVRDFLAGRSNEVSPPETADTATRQLVAEELLATMTGADPEETWPQTEGVPSEDAEAPASQDPEGLAVDQLEVPGRETRLEREQQSKRVNHEEQERARKLFMDHGYFDEAVQDLRGAISPQQRAAAARAFTSAVAERFVEAWLEASAEPRI